MTNVPFVDLVTLADALKSDPRYPLLKPSLLTALRAQSCLSDLQLAQACCDALERFEPDTKENPELERLTIGNALLQQGILLYARATWTSGRAERGAIKLEKKHMSADAYADHKSLVKHRNEVIAHVQKNGDIWHSQSVYVLPIDVGWTYSATTHRLHIDGELCQVLQRQTPIALLAVNDITKKHFSKVMTTLAKGGFPREVWQPHAVDAVALFGSKKAAEEAVARASIGGFSMWGTASNK